MEALERAESSVYAVDGRNQQIQVRVNIIECRDLKAKLIYYLFLKNFFNFIFF